MNFHTVKNLVGLKLKNIGASIAKTLEEATQDRMNRMGVAFDYTECGEKATYHVIPLGSFFGADEIYKEEQWLFEALNLDTGAHKTFAHKQCGPWKPYTKEA